ncbi:hypothetical protein V6N12_032698 [Hibiscus sabdariffa]|uniref:Secreted protein n=1 Tax=Hibiscus sabdariffa TaxID=183260 RepID=A0ABR2BNZ5_9ROSI
MLGLVARSIRLIQIGAALCVVRYGQADDLLFSMMDMKLRNAVGHATGASNLIWKSPIARWIWANTNRVVGNLDNRVASGGVLRDEGGALVVRVHEFIHIDWEV